MSALFEPLVENSPALVLLDKVVPVAITVLLGGWLVNFLFPRLQHRFQQARAEETRRFELAERIVETLRAYVIHWSRLIEIAQLEVELIENGEELSAEQKARKLTYVSDRNAARDELHAVLATSQLYFARRTTVILLNFQAWDSERSNKRLRDLPPISAWKSWETELVDCLRQELRR